MLDYLKLMRETLLRVLHLGHQVILAHLLQKHVLQMDLEGTITRLER